ncbi:MAG: DUF2157 domain-containing protein [Myxococcales bacterium]|nr:DUF2157 domain-containing protein [Myxococcales bacterium]
MSTPPGGVDVLALSARRGRLHALAAAGVLAPEELERGLGFAGRRPTVASWSAYLYWHALIIGVVLLVAGVIFFVAANWSALDGFVRMGLVGGLMVLATLVGGFLGETLAGRAMSLLGGLLFGPLLALYGQIYQTGADAWELFALWTLVLVAYGALVRFAGTWVVALLGLHIACFAWINQELGSDFYDDSGAWIVTALALVDAGVVALGERFTSGRERDVITGTAAYFGLAILLPFSILLIFDEGSTAALPGLVLTILALAAIWLVYRWRRPDLAMLAAFATMITIIVTAACGRLLLDKLDAELWGVTMLGVIVCAQVWAFTRWLLAWRREHPQRHHADAGAEAGGEEVAS